MWIGYKMVDSSMIGKPEKEESSERKGFLEGFMIAFLNPKILVFRSCFQPIYCSRND